jgi:hypothetical protein
LQDEIDLCYENIAKQEKRVKALESIQKERIFAYETILRTGLES